MKLKDNLAKILIPILSILIAFIAGGIIILCLGKNPVEAYGYLFSGAFGSGRTMGQTLVIACPLIFTGLAAALALHRTGCQKHIIKGVAAGAVKG